MILPYVTACRRSKTDVWQGLPEAHLVNLQMLAHRYLRKWSTAEGIVVVRLLRGKGATRDGQVAADAHPVNP